MATELQRHRSAAGPSRAGVVSLPVLRPKGRRARWRALSLTVVWLLMIAHITHWAVTGRSLAPFVLSDSTRTLEAGEINPGFVLFAASLLVALVCGRFLCGWVCHLGSLQDVCAWLMRRVGVRPHLFRSRVLGLAPYLMAFAMFLWPTIRREAAAPALARWWPEALPRLGTVQEFPGFTTRWMTTELWTGLPPAWVAVPFLLVCGFVTVYFLGARGLCRYGCPYGGLLRPAQSLAVWRVAVEPSLCDGCGLCTAACTSGVRVLEETRTTGMVVSRECIRSLDCIEACPHGALSLKLGAPALVAGTGGLRRTYDTSLGEDAVLLVVGVWTFLVTRGLYWAVPMLLAVSLSVLASFLAWKLMRVLRRRDERLPGLQLKRAGRVRPAGWGFIGLSMVLGVLLVHSTAVRVLLWRAGTLDDRVQVSREDVLAPDASRVPESARRDAAAAVEAYRRAGSLRRGGIGLADTPTAEVRIAWLQLVMGRADEAEQTLRALVAQDGGNDTIRREVAVLMLRRGDGPGATAWLELNLKARPSSPGCRELLLSLYMSMGRAADAETMVRGLVEHDPDDAGARCHLGSVLLATGRAPEALAEMERAAEGDARDPRTLDLLATARMVNGDVDGAIAVLDRMARRRSLAAYAVERGAQALEQSGRVEEAARRREMKAP